MNEFPDNIWAPWRMEYIHGLGEKGSGCFLCDYAAAPDRDAANLVLWRTDDTIVMMNRFPYTNGHLMIAPLAHKADMTDLSDDELANLFRQTRDAKSVMKKAVAAHGFNIGINFGLCAGAGLPDHLHVHLVPRWNGDTNFMAVLGDVRVIPEGLEAAYQRFCRTAKELGMPGSP